MSEAGGDLISVDWRVGLDDAWARVGHDRGMQGNLGPTRLLAGWPAVEEGARHVLRPARGRPRHHFNLGPGVLAHSPPQVLKRPAGVVDRNPARRAAAAGR